MYDLGISKLTRISYGYTLSQLDFLLSLIKAERTRQQEEEVAREQNFVTLLQTAQQSLIPNQDEFDCGICFVTVEPGEGVVLRECLHRFCRSAINGF